MQQIQPRQLADWLGAGAAPTPLVLDVREEWETRICRLADSVHIPMQELLSRLDEIEAGRPVVCLCHHGMRSSQVAMFLERRGMSEVYNLAGGIDAWARQVDPSCAIY